MDYELVSNIEEKARDSSHIQREERNSALLKVMKQTPYKHKPKKVANQGIQ